MKHDDQIELHGELTVTVRRAGRVIDQWSEQNLIVDAAREMLARLIAGDSAGEAITHIGFGTSGDMPTPDDSSLTGAHWRALSGHSYPSVGQVRFDFILSTTEANGMVIREFGLRTSAGALFSRKARGGIEKNDDISLEGTWTITL